MEIRKQLANRVNNVILRNGLRRDNSFEIVIYGDINNLDVDFRPSGFGATQKRVIFWEQFDENFDTENFVNKVLTLLSNSLTNDSYVVTSGEYLYFKEWDANNCAIIVIDDQPGKLTEAKRFKNFQEAQKIADVLEWQVEKICN